MRLMQTFDVKMCTYRLIDKLYVRKNVILRKLIESLFSPPSSETRSRGESGEENERRICVDY